MPTIPILRVEVCFTLSHAELDGSAKFDLRLFVSFPKAVQSWKCPKADPEIANEPENYLDFEIFEEVNTSNSSAELAADKLDATLQHGKDWERTNFGT